MKPAVINIQSATCITPEMCQKYNIDVLLCDIDGTLAPQNQALPKPGVIRWVKTMQHSGIHILIVSNNNPERVIPFCIKLNAPYMYKSKKPFSKAIRVAQRIFSTDPVRMAMVGDKGTTDMLFAKFARIKAFKVCQPES